MPAIYLIATAISFALIAYAAPGFIHGFAKRRRLRSPHPILLLVFRIWFALLAVGSLIILVHHPR